MNKKTLLIILLLLVAAGGIVAYMQWNKPHKRVEDASGIVITAEDLSKAFTVNEQSANAKYLNKAIEVTGTVAETETNQDGGKMVVLQTGDPVAGIECTLRDKNATAAKDQKVTIKGFCSGNGITGVTLTDCILK